MKSWASRRASPVAPSSVSSAPEPRSMASVMTAATMSENISALVANCRARTGSPAPTLRATRAAAAMPEPIDTERLENTMVPA